jgi:glycine betaine/proline transport system ATP-binding protein
MNTLASNAPLLTIDRVSKFYAGDEQAAAAAAASGATREELMTRFQSFAAVAEASFEAEAGEILVIMGLSGSGKSTLLRCINRLVEPTSGSVLFQGEDILAASQQRLRELRLNKISMVFQHFALLPHKTVLDNVAFGLKMRGVGKADRFGAATRLLEQVGLRGWEKLYPHNLSGGMKQRVGLARALAVDPDLLLMDEAFSALDPVIRREMQGELVRLQRIMKKTIVFITHDIQEALLVGDRIVMMKDGRIVQIGTPSELILSPKDDFVADFTRDADRARMLAARDIMISPNDSGSIVLPGNPGTTIAIDSAGMALGYRAGSGELSIDFQRAEPNEKLGTLLDRCKMPAPILVTDPSGTVAGAFDRERLIKVLKVGPELNSD